MTEHRLKKRVAVVYPHLPHYRYGVFKELDERIEDVLFVTGGESRDGSIAITPPGSFRREVMVRNQWFGPFLWQQGLDRELNKFMPDAVVFLGDFAYLSTWKSALWSRLRRRKVYFWTIGWHTPESGLRKWVRLLFYSLAHELHLYGETGRALGQASGYPERKMRVIYNSFESRTQVPRPRTGGAKLLPNKSSAMIGAVVRLSTNKGLLEIVRSASLLKRKHGVTVECLIVGEGPLRAELAQEAERLGVPLRMPGAIYDADTLEEVYRLLDVTVLPKAAGLTVLQSLAAGTPVVTVADPYLQMPEFEAIVDGENGSLARSAEPEDLAAAIAPWLTTSGPPKRRGGVGGRAWLPPSWTPAAQADQILDGLSE